MGAHFSLFSLPLRYFLEVARTGSVNQAAMRLHVVASAVSRQLAKLEDSVGVPLFERQPRGMALTAAGSRLLAQALGGSRQRYQPGPPPYEQQTMSAPPKSCFSVVSRKLM